MPEVVAACRLEIGPLRVELRSREPGLIAQLAADYPGFIAPLNEKRASTLEKDPIETGVGPDARLEIVLNPRLRVEDVPPVRFLDGTWIYTGYGGAGVWRADDARLEIESFPSPDIDIFLRLGVCLLALQRGGILMHTAGVVDRGRAYLFFGRSGSGKTTAARLSAPRQVLNDDLILLLPEADQWIAYATPFTNPTQVPPSPGQAPVGGLYRLVQDPRVYIRPISSAVLLAEVISSVPILAGMPHAMPPVIRIVSALIQQVPGGYLHFRKDPDFWGLISGLG